MTKKISCFALCAMLLAFPVSAEAEQTAFGLWVRSFCG